ncbi:MAG TPA: nitroreductase/quinone reductase family protein [Candidatus Limnocylindrales bacterium]
MARSRKYRVITALERLNNRCTRWALRRGLAPRAFALLETTGRRSGLPRHTSVGNGLDRHDERDRHGKRDSHDEPDSHHSHDSHDEPDSQHEPDSHHRHTSQHEPDSQHRHASHDRYHERNSHHRHTSQLDGDTFWLVAAHGLQADYVRNLLADPTVRVKIAGRWRTGRAVPMPDDDVPKRSRSLPYQWDAAIGRLMATTPMTIRIDLDPDPG